MTTALAGLADVATELGLDHPSELSDGQTRRAPTLLIKASALFRRAAGREFTPGEYSHRLQVVGGRVRLPESPVTDVTSVIDDSGNTVAYTRSGDWLTVSGHHDTDASFACYRPPDLQSGWFVTAAYTGGDVPAEVAITVAQMVVRALSADPAVSTGVRSYEQTLGPMTERKQFFDWAADAVTLTDEEKAFAESYRPAGRSRIVHNAC